MIPELVCPDFYIEQWRLYGRETTELNDPKVEFQVAADDGICRLLRTERGEFESLIFVCRCGMKFPAADAKQVEVAR